MILSKNNQQNKSKMFLKKKRNQRKRKRERRRSNNHHQNNQQLSTKRKENRPIKENLKNRKKKTRIKAMKINHSTLNNQRMIKIIKKFSHRNKIMIINQNKMRKSREKSKRNQRRRPVSNAKKIYLVIHLSNA